MALLAGLAAWGLGARSFWIDEGISAGATNELIATWKGTGGTMALYYAVLTPWSWISMHAAWLRVPSLLFAVAAMPVVHGVARRAFDRRVAAVATFCTAGSWLVVRYAQEARSYSLVLLLTSVAWLALVRAVQATDEAERTRWWRIFAVATVLAPLAHGLAILQFAAQAGWLALGPDPKPWLHRLRAVFIATAAVMVVLVAGGANDVASWIPPLSLGQIGDFAKAFTGPGLSSALVLGAATVLGVATCVVRYRNEADAERRWFTLLPLLWGLAPAAALFVLSFARPYFLARYAMASAPGIGMLLALAILGPKPKVRLVRAAAVAIPVVAFLLVSQVDLHREDGDDWTGAAQVVAEGARRGDAVTFVNPAVRSSFDFAWDDLPEGVRTVTPAAFSPVEPIGDLRRFYLIRAPEQLAAQTVASTHDRFWLVEEDGEALEPMLDDLLADPKVADAFRVVQDSHFTGGVRVVLVERR